jgi:drug/metabolite transporter (DMT)-like permease
MMKKTISAYLAASLTTLLWGISYLWSDSLLDNDIPVEFFVPVRMLLAGILLCLINKITGQSMKIQERKDLLFFVLLSLCVPFIYFLGETYGLKYTESPTITSLIVASNPIFSMITGMVIFQEKFGRINVLGVFITLAGLWLVTYTYSSTGEHFLLGIAIIFIAVASEVSQIAFTKSLASRYAPSVIVMYQFLIGSIFFAPLFFTKGIASFDPDIYFSWKVLYPTLALALLCSATAYTSWAFAIKVLGVARTSVFLAIVPLITALAAVATNNENFELVQWIGLAIGMIGLYLTQLPDKSTCKA